MGLSLDELDPPLDDIAFLARSNNRVRVLVELTDDDRTRRELREMTGISQPTLGRILDGFRQRAWVTKRDRAYALTPFGRLLADEFEALMDSVETIQRFRGFASRLPLDAMEFDLRLLAEATITAPKPTDATAHIRREGELLEQADRIQFLCNQAQPETVERYRDWVIERERQLEAIIAGDAIDAARAHPTMGDHLHDLLASDRATIYRYDGSVSIMLGLFDDIASIVPLDDNGVPCAFVESENPAVRGWVSATLEAHREEAEPVAVDTLAD